MSTNFQDVGDFQRKFGLYATEGTNASLAAGPTGLEQDKELMGFRKKFLEEELAEFAEGLDEQDIAKMADALVDLVYVALGTAHFLGIPWQALWDDVQAANMRKIRAQIDGSDSKRGSKFDVVKPDGWVAPNTKGILQEYGFEV